MLLSSPFSDIGKDFLLVCGSSFHEFHSGLWRVDFLILMKSNSSFISCMDHEHES